MKKWILFVTFAAFLALYVGLMVVYSQEEQKSIASRPLPTISSTPRLMMRLMDTNNDGQISEEENRQFFVNADQDKDGLVSIKEIMDLMSKRQMETNGPIMGQNAPDFALTTLDGNNTIRLSDFKEREIVVLVFGNYTSPTFRSQAENLKNVYEKYKTKSNWLFIYTKEANPADGFQADENVKAGITVNQPKTMEERMAVANRCIADLGFSFTVLLDSMDDDVSTTYAAQPERLYIVDKRGRIVYKSEKGPEGFNPQKMAETLARLCST